MTYKATNYIFTNSYFNHFTKLLVSKMSTLQFIDFNL